MALNRTDQLRAYIEAAQEAPVRWGIDDCCRWPFAWAETLGHSATLPAYASEDEARAMIAAAGDLDALVSPMMAAAGLVETGVPGLGDIGLIRMSWGMSGCIFLPGNNVVIRAEKGVGALWVRQHLVVRAWQC